MCLRLRTAMNSSNSLASDAATVFIGSPTKTEAERAAPAARRMLNLEGLAHRLLTSESTVDATGSSSRPKLDQRTSRSVGMKTLLVKSPVLACSS